MPKQKTSSSKVVRQRSKGRPSSEVDAVGRNQIIDASIELLKTRSHNGIKRYEIADHAKVDPALIRYYFGNTDALLGEVIVDLIRKLRANMSVVSDNSPPDSRIEQRIRNTIEFLIEYPRIHSMVDDLIFQKDDTDARDSWRETISISLENLESIIQDGISNGVYKSVDHRMLHLLIVGACVFFVDSSALIADLYGSDATVNSKKEDFVSFLTNIISAGLKPE